MGTLVVDSGKGPHSSSFQAWGQCLGILSPWPHLSSEYGGGGLRVSPDKHPRNEQEVGAARRVPLEALLCRLPDPSFPFCSQLSCPLPAPSCSVSISLSLSLCPPGPPIDLSSTLCVCVCVCVRSAAVPNAGRCWMLLTPPQSLTCSGWDSGLSLLQAPSCAPHPAP